LIPSRHAIARCESPSAANARTCAHSNALRTARLLDVVIELQPQRRSPHAGEAFAVI